MSLARYSKLLRGRTQPRFLRAQRSGFLVEQSQKLLKAKKCALCGIDHAPLKPRAKLAKANDPTFRNAVALIFGRGSAKTPAQIAAQIAKAYGRGRHTLIISGDAAHGLPFLLEMFANLSAPVAVILAAGEYTVRAAKIYNRIIDVFAPTLRWADPGCAAHFGSEGYVSAARSAIALAKGELVVRILSCRGTSSVTQNPR